MGSGGDHAPQPAQLGPHPSAAAELSKEEIIVIAGIPHEELRHTRAAQEWLAEGRQRLLEDPHDQVFLDLALAAATPGWATST